MFGTYQWFKPHANHSAFPCTYKHTLTAKFSFNQYLYLPMVNIPNFCSILQSCIEMGCTHWKRTIHLHKYLIEILWSKFTVTYKCASSTSHILIWLHQEFVNIHSIVHCIEVLVSTSMYGIGNQMCSKCNQLIWMLCTTGEWTFFEKQQKKPHKRWIFNFGGCVYCYWWMLTKNSIKPNWNDVMISKRVF